MGGSVNGDEGGGGGRGGRKRASGGGGERVRSGFIGVSLNGNRWSARISVAGKKTSLGGYDTEKEAALAYDRASRQQFGEKARCNVSEKEEGREGGREGTGRTHTFSPHFKDSYSRADIHSLAFLLFPFFLPSSLPPFYSVRSFWDGPDGLARTWQGVGKPGGRAGRRTHAEEEESDSCRSGRRGRDEHD